MTGSVSAHLAQGHSAAGEKEMVSWNSAICTISNFPLLIKDWFFGRSCVTCCIHTDPLILFNPSIHCLFPNSSPVHYVICSVLVEQDRCVFRLQGSIWVKPPLVPAQSNPSLDWNLPLGFGLVSNSSPLLFIITNPIKITRFCEPRVQLDVCAPGRLLQKVAPTPVIARGTKIGDSSQFSAMTTTTMD